MPTTKEYIVQPAEKGGFEVIAIDGERASGIFPTQAEAEVRAKELNPDNLPHIRRVRHTGGARPGEFREGD